MHRTAVRSDNREEINPFEGVTDPVEIIRIFHEKRSPRFRYTPYEKPLHEVYQLLSDSDMNRLYDTMRELLEKDAEDTFAELAVECIAFAGKAIRPLHSELLDKELYYPPMMFRGADESICEKLVEKLEEPDQNRDHILTALAWIGSPKVVSLFASWKEVLPDWADELYIPPYEYAHEAGWSVDEAGNREQLYSEDTYALTTDPENASLIDSFKRSSNSCPWCGTPLVTLFTIDGSQFGKKSGLFPIQTCYHCSAYADSIFMELAEDGTAHWAACNEKPSFLPDDPGGWELPQEHSVYLSTTKRAALFAANQFLPVTFSQIGGFPSWQQDAEFPTCPRCNKKMHFVGQVDNADVEEFGEGIYYNFLCFDCRVTATGYQQT